MFPVGIGAFANFIPEIGEIMGNQPKYAGSYVVGDTVKVLNDGRQLTGELAEAVCGGLRQHQLRQRRQLPLRLLSPGQGRRQLRGLGFFLLLTFLPRFSF